MKKIEVRLSLSHLSTINLQNTFMKYVFSKIILICVVSFAITYCDNGSDEDLLLFSPDSNIIVPEISPNDDLTNLVFNDRSSESQFFVEY